MKYIIFQEKDSGNNIPYVLAFDEAFVHRDSARGFGRQSEKGFYAVSAGFFYRDPATGQIVVPAQKSDSMNMGPRPEDQAILTMAIDQGLSGLDILNMQTLAELTTMKRGKTRKHP
jgi:hypothetical protein